MSFSDGCADIFCHQLHLSESTKQLFIHCMQLQASIRFKGQILLKLFNLTSNDCNHIFFLRHSLLQ